MDLREQLDPTLFDPPKKGAVAAKLSFEERCAILALRTEGIRREVLAEVFGIDRRTVSHISSTQSPHYREVRLKQKQMGVHDFAGEYLTQPILDRMAAYKAKEVKTDELVVAGRNPDRRAHQKAGRHTLTADHLKKPHRVEINWTKTDDAEGWMSRDLDGPFPDDYSHYGPESLLTSSAALSAAEANLMD